MVLLALRRLIWPMAALCIVFHGCDSDTRDSQNAAISCEKDLDCPIGSACVERVCSTGKPSSAGQPMNGGMPDDSSTTGGRDVSNGGGASMDGAPQECAVKDDAPTGNCPDGQTCIDDRCSPWICKPGTTRCSNAATLEICQPDGQGYDEIMCMQGNCREQNGAATCDDVICVPGDRTCNGEQTVVECTPDGSRYAVAEQCDGARTGRRCESGECVPLCRINEKTRTNIGCDYWAADLDNAFVPGRDGFLNAARAPYAIVVSNPHPSFTAGSQYFEQ